MGIHAKTQSGEITAHPRARFPSGDSPRTETCSTSAARGPGVRVPQTIYLSRTFLDGDGGATPRLAGVGQAPARTPYQTVGPLARRGRLPRCVRVTTVRTI